MILIFSCLILPLFAKNCSDWKEEHLFKIKEIEALNITSPFVIITNVNDLEDESLVECSANVETKMSLLKVYATNQLLLPTDLNLTSILNLFTFESFERKQFFFQNIKGFNLRTNATPLKKRGSYQTSFFEVNFEFYLDGVYIASQMCEKFLFKNTNFFSWSKIQLNEQVFYRQQICQYIFMNSNPIQIDLFQITRSLIFKNRLEFLNINEKAEYDMRLERFDLPRLSVAFEEITLNMVNKHVFKHMKYLHLFGIIEFIEIELFAHFKKIKYIQYCSCN